MTFAYAKRTVPKPARHGVQKVAGVYKLMRYIMKQQKKMAYKKPRLIAKNNPTGSFAAGCPAKDRGFDADCLNCERTR